ncbi:MAG: hypothetical protein R3F49_04090 [Planctomycetota bacterium]
MQHMIERELVLHIGAPKTGTTATQRFFTEAAPALAQRGVLYPDVCLRGYGHHDLAFLIGGGYPAWATPQARDLESLAVDLDAALMSDAPQVILSSEDFFLQPDPAALKALLERSPSGRRTRVLVHVRRQDHMALSWYNQAVKAQGFTGTFAECERETAHLWDYAAQLEAWAAAFGADALIVRVYERGALVADDIVLDVLAALEIDAAGLARVAAPVNTRLVRDILEFQRQVNRLPLSREQKRRFHKQLMALSEATRERRIFDDAPLIGPSERRTLIERYAASNREVAQRWLGRDELFSEPLPGGPEPAPWPGADATRTQLIFGWILSNL